MKLAEIEGMGKYIERVPFPQRPVKVQKDDFIRLLNEYGEFEEVVQIQKSERELSSTLRQLNRTPSDKMDKVALEALQSRGWTEAEAKQVIARIKGGETADMRNDVIEKTIEKTTIKTVTQKLGLEGMPDEVIATFRPQYKAGANEAIFYRNGKPYLYELDPELHKAVSSVGGGEVNLLIKFMQYPAAWLRAGATTFSPEFGIRNPMRDQMTAWLQSNYGFVPGYDFLRGVFHIMRASERPCWISVSTSGPMRGLSGCIASVALSSRAAGRVLERR